MKTILEHKTNEPELEPGPEREHAGACALCGKSAEM